MKERRALRAAFVVMRSAIAGSIVRSQTTRISLRRRDHTARADPTHSARDGRKLRRRRWIRHSNSTLRDAIARCQQY